MQQQDSSGFSSASAVSFCPSFNSYSSDNLADIAAKVERELKLEESNSNEEEQQRRQEQNNDDEDDDDFEFFSRFDAQIHQVFPVFNRDLLKDVDYYNYHHNQGDERSRHVAEPVGGPLKKLFVDGDDDGDHHQGGPSSSSSDADDPEKEEVPELAFCIWTPKRNPTESSPSRCKKSNSTGSSSTASSSSSRKWMKFRDLLKRSNSDGKDSFVFLSKQTKEKKGSKEVKSGKTAAAVSPHEAFYVENRAIKQGDKKKSYLPYRQDLLGFFATYNGLGKTFPPF